MSRDRTATDSGCWNVGLLTHSWGVPCLPEVRLLFLNICESVGVGATDLQKLREGVSIDSVQDSTGSPRRLSLALRSTE